MFINEKFRQSFQYVHALKIYVTCACSSGFQRGKVPMKYDVIIVGAGPAGIFSALELTEKTNLNVLILDRGADIDKRKCPSQPRL